MSGVVKGVKKAFKAIGNAVKKVLKSPIFKVVLGVAAAIFTGGAAIGAFGAMGTAGATFGSVVSAAVSGGLAPFQAALGALGMGGGAAATTGAEIAGTAATGAAEGALGAAAEGGASALAGAAEMVGPSAELAGGFVGPSAELAGAMVGPPTELAGAGWNLMGPPADLAGSGASAIGNVVQSTVPSAASGGTFAPPSLSGLTGSPGALNLPASVTQGAAGSGLSGSEWLSKIWQFMKPETADGYRMYGNLLMGVGQGVMQGRAAQDEREWRQRMSAVPDVTQSFQAKPDFRWALMGGK